MKRRTQIGPRAGLTLVELVVVLMILVIVAGTAMTAAGGLVDESHYESTQSELRSLESALLGHYDSASHDGDDAISFVADVGRLPFVASADPEFALAELWEKPSTVEAFGIQSPLGDPAVQLPGGWRGPYLRLGFGSAKLVDGWGRPYAALAADDTIAPIGTEVFKLRTLGADQLAGGTGYELDATLVLKSTAPSVVGARHLGDVPVRVLTPNVLEEVVIVRIYGARNGDVVTLDEWPAAGSPSVPANGDDVSLVFRNVPVGPRVVRAYRTTKPPATMDAPFEASATPSSIHAITVVQGGIAEVEIELP